MKLTEQALGDGLKHFGLDLEPRQLSQVSTYIELLVRWSKAVNLTAIRQPQEILARHFGESMYLATAVELTGSLLDIGSGAGFPGLALKIARPELRVVLLEPVAKKRAFLKEVVRACELGSVEVSCERAGEFSAGHGGVFDAVTARAVGGFDEVLPAAWRVLAKDGCLYLWLTGLSGRRLADSFAGFNSLFAQSRSIRIPMSRDREIWCGRKRSGAGFT